MEDVRCALCAVDDSASFLEKAGYTLVRCNRCGLVYLNPRPTPKEMETFYDEDFYDKGTSQSNRLVRATLGVLQVIQIWKITSLKRPGRILDIGCGEGRFLENMAKKGWEAYGVEPSASGFRLAQARLGANVFNSELQSCGFLTSYFDVVTMWHVFEHVAQPRELLREIRRVLKDDGILILSIPNIDSVEARLAKEDWFHLDLPRHLYFYSPSSIEKILGTAGFTVKRINHLSLEYKHVLLYSLFSLVGRFRKARGMSSGTRDNFSRPSRLLIFVLLPVAVLLSYVFALCGRSGTIEVCSVKS